MATQSQLIQLTIALYNAAPGADVLAELTALNNAGASLKDLAEALDNTATYKALYPDTLTNEQFAEAFVNTYIGTEASELAKADLVTWTVATLNSGESRGATMQIINDALAGSNEARWADAKQAFLNKTEVAEFYSVTQALSGATVAELQGSIASVTSDAASVIAAKAGLTPQVAGEKFNLTSGTDRGADFDGTADNDQYNAFLQQNSFSGGVSNSLSSADKLDGGAGTDSLYAEIVPEFFGATGNNQIDIQARTANIENVQFEARDAGSNDTDNTIVTVDAKNMLDIDKIGSYMSDGNLVIENLTTQQSEGGDRNTSDITITMDHTDNFNSDNDASNLTVYFDEDYLLAGQSTSASRANYFLLDEDSTDIAGAPLLNLDKAGIIFTIDGVSYTVAMADAVAGPLDTYAEFAAGLQTALDAMVAGGATALAGLNIVVDPAITIIETAITVGGVAQSITIPAISVIDSQGRDIQPTGFADTNDQTGQFNTVGRFNNETATTSADPVSVNVELNKVGREGEGGDLLIGGKELDQNGGAQNQGNGIEVFNIDVLGDATKLSNLGSINSTNNALKTVNIETVGTGTTFASLTVRDAFDASANIETVNANAFKGDLNIGQDDAALNVNTFTATGGGEVTYNAEIDGTEKGVFTNTTGAANDTITVDLDGDAVDTAETSFAINAGNGNNTVTVDMQGAGVSVATTADLDNLSINTGSGTDKITLIGGTTNGAANDGDADFNIASGAGSDFVHINSMGDDDTSFTNTAAVTFAGTEAAGGADTFSITITDAGGSATLLVTVATGAAATAATIGAVVPAATPTTATFTAAVVAGVVTITSSADADFTLSTAQTAGTAGEVTFTTVTDGSSTGTGLWTVGTETGASLQTVMYKATVEVNFGGFDSALVDVVTTAANNFIATQADINAAVKKAIAETPELANLLTVTDGTGSQQLKIESTVEGNSELTITLDQPTVVTATPAAGQVLLATGDLTGLQLGLLETTTVAGGSVGVDTATKVAALVVATNNPIETGTDGTDETVVSNVATIDMGTGTNDLVVLNSHDDSVNTLDFTAAWGKVSVVNFFDSAVAATNELNDATAQAATNTEGLHQIDFTAWLNDMNDPSANPTNTQSEVRTVTTDTVELATGVDFASNEVVIVNNWAATSLTAETFAGMTASAVQLALTTAASADAYGNLGTGAFTATATNVGDTQSSILMVENDLNAGEYKVFNVETTGTSTAPTTDDAFAVTLIGTVDFGAQIDNAAVFTGF